MTSWSVHRVAPGDPVAAGLVRAYLSDIVGRYYGRPATSADVDTALAEDPTDDLVGFFVGHHDGRPAGCAGFRLVTPDMAESKRLYVERSSRGTGGGAALLMAVERAASSRGATKIRLDTRTDLVEARALYARHGYSEVERYSAGRYAEHFFTKAL
ncbi:GNAT family N-acetyltransferase [Saccharothrix violaceirubra]|uniref:GNAT superfamily N-acetyltransferase n=1 Tax=Saccharothrix violaceirubra TaxID=413306 RepID=A0A7W7T5U6_9PSEU|nr:GNAT family N-acetyltransferase [Saccharothrix violaceirubra]MBB4967132.1 GNAT superfamily N-acetyltransferase [Saccharothrix violaceirubra]